MSVVTIPHQGSRSLELDTAEHSAEISALWGAQPQWLHMHHNSYI